MIINYVLLTGLGLVFLWPVFMLIRNKWVYNQQRHFIDECYDRPTDQWRELGRPGTADIAASYDEMMRKFWIWDREKFRKRKLPDPSQLVIYNHTNYLQ